MDTELGGHKQDKRVRKITRDQGENPDVHIQDADSGREGDEQIGDAASADVEI